MRKLEEDLEAVVKVYEVAMRNCGYKGGSMRVVDGRVRDVDRIDEDGKRHFATLIDGEWCYLSEVEELHEGK